MKRLTYSSLAAARLRANKRQYLSLVLGIFLSIFLVSALIMAVYGIYLAQLEKRYDRVGYQDMVLLDNSVTTQEYLMEFGLFDRVGHAYVSGVVTDRNLYVGYYDEEGLSLINLTPKEGRLPESPGEIALEESALDVLDMQLTIGDPVELPITAIDGGEETRTYTVVGILPERSVYLERSDLNGVGQFPAIVTSGREPAFVPGRLAEHCLFTLSPGVSMNQALGVLWGERNKSVSIDSSSKTISGITYMAMAYIYGLSASGEQVQFTGLGNWLDADRDMYTLMAMAFVLAAALIISCAVGISGAMEGMLSKRREEIGVLRALGATRRQIRRMFGRENLILGLVVSPLSILAGCAAVWGLSRFLPEDLIFRFQIWLLLPIALFSLIVILLAGYLPLARASRQMPMGVIRDTAMLRRSKRLTYKKEFVPARLIVTRQLRFYPTRQLGAAVLVGLMLLSSGLFTVLLQNFQDDSTENQAGFVVYDGGSTIRDGNNVNVYLTPSMDQQSLNQLKGLSHVDHLEIDRCMTVTAVLDRVPRYAFSPIRAENHGMLDEEQFQEALTYCLESDAAFYEQTWETSRKDYLQFLEDQNISGQAFNIDLVTIELSEENLERLSLYMESGKINADAVNAGEEVILLAPQVWMKPYERGGYQMWPSEEYVNMDPDGEDAVLVAWNDAFTAGQSLPILQLYKTEEDGPVTRRDAQVTVGAVVSQYARLSSFSSTHATILTTEQGLANMGLRVEGLYSVEVYPEGNLSQEEEQALERQINAIARRTEGFTVLNLMKSYREQAQANRQMLLLCFSVALLFFAVAVGMIVSSVTRSLNSEGRTIGMLRAVGAEEKTLLSAYGGQIFAAVGGGMLLSLGLVGMLVLFSLLQTLRYSSRLSLSPRELQMLIGIGLVILLMGAACYLVCRLLLRLRIREIVNKSIIENIREL